MNEKETVEGMSGATLRNELTQEWRYYISQFRIILLKLGTHDYKQSNMFAGSCATLPFALHAKACSCGNLCKETEQFNFSRQKCQSTPS